MSKITLNATAKELMAIPLAIHSIQEGLTSTELRMSRAFIKEIESKIEKFKKAIIIAEQAMIDNKDNTDKGCTTSDEIEKNLKEIDTQVAELINEEFEIDATTKSFEYFVFRIWNRAKWINSSFRGEGLHAVVSRLDEKFCKIFPQLESIQIIQQPE
jgi:hypothetical protein